MFRYIYWYPQCIQERFFQFPPVNPGEQPFFFQKIYCLTLQAITPICMNFNQNSIINDCSLYPLSDNNYFRANDRFLEKPGNIFGIEVDAAMADSSADSIGSIRAMNEYCANR